MDNKIIKVSKYFIFKFEIFKSMKMTAQNKVCVTLLEK